MRHHFFMKASKKTTFSQTHWIFIMLIFWFFHHIIYTFWMMLCIFHNRCGCITFSVMMRYIYIWWWFSVATLQSDIKYFRQNRRKSEVWVTFSFWNVPHFRLASTPLRPMNSRSAWNVLLLFIFCLAPILSFSLFKSQEIRMRQHKLSRWDKTWSFPSRKWISFN